MNKQYKCIWNSRLCVWIAVSEKTKNKSKVKSSALAATGILILSTFLNTQTFAGSVNVCTGANQSTALSSTPGTTIVTFGCISTVGVTIFENNNNLFKGITASFGVGIGKGGNAPGTISLFAPNGTTIESVLNVTGLATLENGASLNNTKITNLAKGTVSATSTEGINGGQLFGANQNIATALGGGSTVDANGNLTTPSYSVGGSTVNNIGAAISNIDGRTTTNTTAIGTNTAAIGTNTTAISTINSTLSQGAFSVSANGTGAVKVAQDAVIDYSNKDSNLKVSQSATNFIFDLADQLNIKTGVSVGNAALSTTGLNISGGPSFTTTGINAANTKITNLTNGAVSATSTEGINGGQLFGANQNIATALGGGSTVDANGNLTAPSYSVGGSTVNNVGAAISNIDTRTTSNTAAIGTNSTAISTINSTLSQGAFSVSANGTGAVKVAQNAVIDYSNKDSNLKVSQSATNFIFDLADQLNIKTGVSVGNAALSTTGLNITGGPSFTTTGINAANTKITNLTNGAVSATSTEGINGGQLFGANQNVATALGGGSTVDASGNLTAPSYSVGGSTVNNIGAAISNIDGRTTTNTTAIGNISSTLSQGAFSVSANGTGAVKVAQNAVIDYSNKDSNLKVSQSATNFIFDLADQLNIKTGVSVGNAALSSTGLNITGGPSFTTTGINAANTKITNLTNGAVSAASTEGINGGQLFGANQNVATALGGGSTVDANGNLTAPSYSVGGTTVGNVGAAISNIDGRTTTNTTAISTINSTLSQGAFSVSANGTGAVKVAQNAVIDYSNKDSNLKVSQSATNFIFDLADQLNIKTAVSVGNAALSSTGLNISGGPSFTTTGINAANTKITNLANGAVSAASTEGINGGQLFGANQNIATALGGGSTVDANGNLTTPSYSVGGSTVNNVGAAISNIDTRTTSNTAAIGTNSTAISTINSTLSQGAFSVSANGIGAVKVAQNAVIDYSNKDSNLKVSQSATNFIFDLADQLNIKTAVSVGNAALSSTGLNISGGPSFTTTGINAANTKITNLANGAVSATSTEGINGGQLFGANQNIATAFGGGSTVDANGNLTAPSYSVGGTTVASVGAAISNVDARVSNIQNSVNNITLKADASVSYDVDAAGGLNKNKVSLAGDPATTAKDQYANTVVTQGGTLISNVANGVNAADAVNKGQLDSTLSSANNYTNQEVSKVTGGLSQNLTRISSIVSNLQNGHEGLLQANRAGQIVAPAPIGENALAGGSAAQARGKNAMAIGNKAVASADYALALGNDSAASADYAMALGSNAVAHAKNTVALGSNSVADRENTVSVGNDEIQRQITHVAAGTANTDAVNVQQLQKMSSRLDNKTEVLNQQINQVNQHVYQVDRRSSAAIAGVSAMANIPQALVGGQRSIGVGVGHHRGQNAVALGGSMSSDSGRWVFKGSAAFNSQDKSTYGAGVSRVW